MAKTVYIFWGELGSNPEHSAINYSIQYHLPYWDADEHVKHIAPHCPLEKMIAHNWLLDTREQIVAKALHSDEGIVMTQTLYLDIDRWQLKNYLEQKGLNTVFYYKNPSICSKLWTLYKMHNIKLLYHFIVNHHMFHQPTHDYRPAK